MSALALGTKENINKEASNIFFIDRILFTQLYLGFYTLNNVYDK